MIKMAKISWYPKIDTLFMTTNAEKTILFGAANSYKAHVREYPTPPWEEEEVGGGDRNIWLVQEAMIIISWLVLWGHVQAMLCGQKPTKIKMKRDRSLVCGVDFDLECE